MRECHLDYQSKDTDTDDIQDDTKDKADTETLPEVERIVDELYSPAKDEVTHFSLNENEEATFHIWDFGGQHVFYTSHQTFLSSRAIYLLIMDTSKSLDDKVLNTQGEHCRWRDKGAPSTVRGKPDLYYYYMHGNKISIT